MTIEYQPRGSFFAHKAFRKMHKSSAAADMGRDAFCLVAVVLHTEDAARYRGPVRFFNSQLMETLGFAKWETFDKARKRAIDSGWLQYRGCGKRTAGLYWVTVPADLDDMDDMPIEESIDSLSPKAGYKEGYKVGYKEGYDRGIIEGINGDTIGAQSGVRSGRKQGEPSTLLLFLNLYLVLVLVLVLKRYTRQSRMSLCLPNAPADPQ